MARPLHGPARLSGEVVVRCRLPIHRHWAPPGVRPFEGLRTILDVAPIRPARVGHHGGQRNQARPDAPATTGARGRVYTSEVMGLRDFSSFLGTLLTLALLAACVGAAYNVLRDDQDVYRLAQEAACAGLGDRCNPQGLLWERGPLGHTYELLTSKGEVVRVRCVREYVLFGDDACEVRDFRPFTVPTFTVAPASAPPAPRGKGGRVRAPATRGVPVAREGGT